ncbi:phosphoglycerate kinase, partial [Candidatus Peregrinibacteria bacterium]|nr:phosphoglycerate kinase [Candidatus Peregrinibacteria bacterium]
AKNLKDGKIIMLENTRFLKEEEENNENFSKKLASLADLYVNDAFGTAHRAHASTEGVAHHLPSYAGKLMEKEIKALSPLIEKEPGRPLIMILGGAKIDTKIGLIKAFMEKSDYMVLGGGLANTFLAAAGYDVGNSLYEKEKIETAREIMLEFEKNHEKLTLPMDVVAADEITETAQSIDAPIKDVMGSMRIVDIGKWTAEKYCNLILECATVIWNGPMGVYEVSPFKEGTKAIAECIAKHKCDSIIGGGDTVDAIKKSGISLEKFTHVSTGGGACIEFLKGKTLPGIKVLQ